jgi:hypothetical protein
MSRLWLVSGLHITGSTSIVTPMARPFSPAMPAPAPCVDRRRGVEWPARLADRRGLAVITATALAVFHARLLWDRLAAGRCWSRQSSFDGARARVARRLGLRRAGVSLALDRHSLAVWLLVALLHWNAGPLPAGNSTTAVDSSAILLVLPSTAAALIGIGAALASLATPARRFPPLACLVRGTASGRAPCERMAPRRRLARSPSRHHLSLSAGPSPAVGNDARGPSVPSAGPEPGRRSRERGAAAIAGQAASLPA